MVLGGFPSTSFASSYPGISNRNNLGNRNHRNAPVTNDLIFSNRNKIGGVAGKKSEDFTNIYPKRPITWALPDARLALGLKCSAAAFSAASNGFEFLAEPAHRDGFSSIKPPGSSFQNLIATQINGNLLNSTGINETHRSNRNKRKGSRGPGEGRTGDTKGPPLHFPRQRSYPSSG